MASVMISAPEHGLGSVAAAARRGSSLLDADLAAVLELGEIADRNALARGEAGQNGDAIAGAGAEPDRAPLDGVAVNDEHRAGRAGSLHRIARQRHAHRRLAARLLRLVGQKR